MSIVDDLKSRTFPVLDKGSVVLMDCMGSDHDICQAARSSYGKGTKSTSDDDTLIRYLYRHSHSSPFEMASVKFHVRAPIFVLRQLERHRSGRMCEEQSQWDDPSVNETSARFSEAITDMLETGPDGWRGQSATNKQGSGGTVAGWPGGFVPSGLAGQPSFESSGHYLTAMERYIQHKDIAVYEERLRFGVAREQARKDLPQSCYSEAVICYDLRNLLHMLGLRLESDVQPETKAYAEVLAREIVAPLFPLSWAAFRDYRLSAITLSALDIQAIRHVQAGGGDGDLAALIPNARERAEAVDKMKRLGIMMG